MQQHSFGHWLKRRRKALDLTQGELASQVGCSAAAIRKIEAEERRPSAQIVGRLAEVFNILPNEQTSFLRFARGDWHSAPARENEDVPWRAVGVLPRSNLPAPTTSLIGRKDEVDVIRQYLSNASIRLVTLIGPPGIGKTRLSLEVAGEVLSNFPNGVFFIPLAPLDDPELVAPTIVQTVGFVETKNQAPLERLKDGIEDKKMLLVLDNLEHLIEGAAQLISELLRSCPHLKILTTSRESLRAPGEWLYSVPTFDVPGTSQLSSIEMEAVTEFPALALFAERARAVQSDFNLTAENIESVAAICTQLDGLPLAIELVAARIRWMSPQLLLTHLNSQFTLYADGIRAVPPRQKTLHGAISWSYDLLSVEEQRLFVYVSIFAGGFTLDAAGAIFSQTSTDKSVTELLTSLLDKSLLQRALDREARGVLRFNMLMTIQQFALDHLRRIGEETEVRNWHLTHFLDLAEQADKEMHGPHQVEWMNRLEKELDNFRAALDWCVSNKKAELGLRLLGALSWTWFVRDHFSEFRSWFDKIRVLPRINAHPALYARLLNHMGMQSWLLGDFHAALSVLEESRGIWLKLGADGEKGLAGVWVYLGLVTCAREGDNKTAQSFFEHSFELYQKHGDRWGMAFVLFNLGGVVGERIDNNLALSLLEQSLELFHQLGDVWGIGRASQWMGQHFLKEGNYEKARIYFDQHLRIDEGLHFKQGTMIALQNLGTLYRYQGDYPQAEDFYQKGLLICREYGGKWELSNNFFYLGLLALHQNDYLLARHYFIDYFHLARAIYAGGTDACDLFAGLAAVAAGTSQAERAAKLYGAAQAVLDTTDYRIHPFDLAEFERHIQIAREQLGEAAFEVPVTEGRAMTLEEAIAYALKDNEQM